MDLATIIPDDDARAAFEVFERTANKQMLHPSDLQWLARFVCIAADKAIYVDIGELQHYLYAQGVWTGGSLERIRHYMTIGPDIVEAYKRLHP